CHVHLGGKVLHQLFVGDPAQLGRVQATFDLLHVLLFLDGRQNGGVGRRPANALFLELFHQRRFGIARRRLSEVLLVQELEQLQHLAVGQRRQRSVLVVALGRFGLLPLRFFLRRQGRTVDREVPGKFEDRSVGAEGRSSGGDLGGGLIVDRRLHLAGDESIPDQLVEPKNVPLEKRLYPPPREILGSAAELF